MCVIEVRYVRTKASVKAIANGEHWLRFNQYDVFVSFPYQKVLAPRTEKLQLRKK